MPYPVEGGSRSSETLVHIYQTIESKFVQYVKLDFYSGVRVSNLGQVTENLGRLSIVSVSSFGQMRGGTAYQAPATSFCIAIHYSSFHSALYNVFIASNHNNKNFWEELIAYVSVIRNGPRRKRRVQQLYFGVCIRCAVKFLPSRCLATIGEYTYRHRLMGGIYEVGR
jgi:hypothetical protein